RMTRLDTERGEHAETEGATPHRAAHEEQLPMYLGKISLAEALGARGTRHDERELRPVPDVVRLRELQHPLRRSGRGLALTPVVLEHRGHPQRDGRGERMSQVVREPQGVAHERLGALRVPEQPLDDRALVATA